MQKSNTGRGFGIYNFEDSNCRSCSIQESSSAEEPKLWLGCNEIDLKHFIPKVGWVEVDLTTSQENEVYIANTRMHLTREQVAELLPLLQAFVETGELP